VRPFWETHESAPIVGSVGAPPTDVLESICRVGASALGASLCAILRSDAGNLTFRAWIENAALRERNAALLDWAQTLCRHVAGSGQAVVVDDSHSGPIADGPAHSGPVPRAFATLPLRDRAGTVVGALCLAAKDPRRWSDARPIVDDLTTLALAEYAGDSTVRIRHESGFRALLESISDVITIVDESRTIRYINPQAERVCGIPAEEMIGRPIWDFVHPDDAQMLDERVASRFRGESDPARFTEIRVRHRDGSWRVLQLRARPFNGFSVPAIVVTGRDITELRQAEEERLDLLARERAARAEAEAAGKQIHGILESITDYFFALDREWRFTYVNRRAEELLGAPREELIGRNIWETFPQAVGSDFYREYRRAMAEQTPVVFQSPSSVSPDRWLETHAYPSPDGLAVYASDITDRRRLEEQLRQAQKMEAVGRLAGGVAHDFNNVLTGIKGYAEFLIRELAEGDPRRHDAEEIRRAADRAADLTRQLLVFSRKQVLQPRRLDLTVVLAEMERMLRRLIGEDIELVTRNDIDLWPVHADPGQLEQVILNLAVNARDAMPRGGRLILETRNVVLDADAAAGLEGAVVTLSGSSSGSPRPGKYVCLLVSDTGCGIPPEIRDRIFEPFFTTKDAGKGTGLGLSTVYGIVVQSGGFIRLDSREGEGTTFKIYLPRAKDSAELAPRTEAHDDAGRRDKIRRPSETTILLVEDEPMVRRLALRVLETAGFQVLEAGSGEHALRLSRECGGRIDLLITDVVMPQMSGRELSRQLAAARPDLRVLYMSGHSEDTIHSHGLIEPDRTFIEKPFTPAGLLRKVEEALAGPAVRQTPASNPTQG